MSFTLFPTVFQDFVTRVPAQFLNLLRVSIAQAIDGAGGGVYTPTAVIEIGGTFGLKLSATGPSAQWLQLGSRTVTMHHSLSLQTVKYGVGVGGTDTSGILAESDLTTSIGGITVASPCIISPPGAQNGTQASYYLIELERPPDASTLVSVTLRTKGITGAAGTLPRYTVVSWPPGGSSGPTAISAVDIVDDHTLGVNYLTNIRAQLLALSGGGVTVDISASRYGVLVKNPFDVAGSSFRLYGVSANYTVTSHRY